MKIFFILFSVFLFPMDSRAQKVTISPVDSLIQKVNLLSSLKPNDSLVYGIKNELVTSIKEYSDHLYYSTLWDLANQELDKPKRILLLREITLYPYYRTNINAVHYWAQYFCISANLSLVKEYSGNLEELNTITVDPAFVPYVYPNLKREIEGAGGKWERGEIPALYHHREIFQNK